MIVVADNCRPAARRLVRALRPTTVGMLGYCEATRPASVFGCHQRDVGILVSRGRHLAFLDDDDVYLPGALDLFRAAVAEQPEAVHVFRAEWGPGHHACGTVLWREREFQVGNVATCMVVYPRSERMPLWMEHNEAGVVSDFGWMQAAAAGREIVWHEQLVATVRPEAAA